jgi:hypothetical protein
VHDEVHNGYDDQGHTYDATAVTMQPVSDNDATAALIDSLDTDSSPSSHWIIDSGASQHFCCDRSLLQSYTATTGDRCRVGDGTVHAIHGVGTVRINIASTTGTHHTPISLKGVLYVPGLRMNLVSVTALTRDGFGVSFTEKGCALSRDNVVLTVIRRTQNNLHRLTLRPSAGQLLAATVTTVHDHSTWHTRMGHLNTRSLLQLFNDGMAADLDCADIARRIKSTTPSSPCAGCLIGKQTRNILPKTTKRRSSTPLDLVHMDLCGPLPVQARNGARYMMLIVDDCTRFVHVKFLKSKSQAFDAFKVYRQWAENLHSAHGHRIHRLRTDNGGEFISAPFLQYLAEHGIASERTVAYTPQQNGVVERRNRTVLDRSRTLLHTAGLPKSFWSEAASTAVYLLNRSPTSTLNRMTPYEAWTGMKPDLEHIRVFGSLAYTHVPQHKRDKLAPRSSRGVMVGYSLTSPAWMIWDESTRKVTESRDVIFDEHTMGTQAAVEGGDTDVFTPSKASSLTTANPFSALSNPSPPVIDSSQPVAPDQPPQSIPPPPEAAAAVPAALPPPASSPASPVQSLPLRPSIPKPVKAVKRKGELGKLQDFNSSGAADLAANRHMPSLIPQYDQSLPQLSADSEVDEEKDAENEAAAHSIALCETVTDSCVSALSAELYGLTATSSMPITSDPLTIAEAMRRPNWVQWSAAIKAEYDALVRNCTFTLVPLPRGCHAIGCKWVLKTKCDSNGVPVKCKARLVAKGYGQRHGVDYDETFAPVCRYGTIRFLCCLAAQEDWECHQMDVTSAFLNGDLKEDVYMRQPEGFIKEGEQHLVCKLNKSLYGLKQAGRTWNQKIDATLRTQQFTSLDADHCVYVRQQGSVIIIIALYVDDLLLFSNSLTDLNALKATLATAFTMTDLGEATFILGIQIKRDRAARTLTLSQSAYAVDILTRHDMKNCNEVATPTQPGLKLVKSTEQATPDDIRKYQAGVGAVMFLMCCTRPDISYAVNSLSQFSSNPDQSHKNALKHLLRYIKGTTHYGITYHGTKGGQPCPVGYCDADWAGNTIDRRSTGGYVFLMGEGPISWQSKRQKTQALSSTEAEYMALASATKEALWLRVLITGLRRSTTAPTALFCDNQSAIKLAENPQFHEHTKHIAVRYHLIRHHIAEGTITVDHVSTLQQAADCLTKGLARVTHGIAVRLLGMSVDAQTI